MSRLLNRLLFVTLLISTDAAFAQLVIQQPIVSQLGVQTSVMVPDRGTFFLGGVSRGAESRFMPGPCGCRGSSIGREFSSVSLTTSVWIQDLTAIDRMVLDLAEDMAPPPPTRIEGRADAAFRMFRKNVVAPVSVDEPPTPPLEPVGEEALRKLNDPARSWRLGQAAEANAKLGVAKLHYQHAARLGSVEAATRLKQMARDTPQ